MYDYLIQTYVERMKESDVDEFAKQNGIILSEKEINLILNYIKKDWRTLLHGNPRKIFQELESQLDSVTYKRMIELYRYFKEKYQNYL